jgi:hypothetical protein
MNEFVPYLFLFIIVVILIRIFTMFTSRFTRVWQTCGQKYRLNFKVASEDKGGRSVRAYRLKGYYRTCLLSIFSSPTIGQSETSVTVSYPKNLLDNLNAYPEGTLNRIGKGLSRQVDAQRNRQSAFYITMPPAKGSNTEIQKELNPQVRERLIQLMIVCSGRGRRIDVTDAYLLFRQQGFTKNPEELFPIIDEMLAAINVIEDNTGELLK